MAELAAIGSQRGPASRGLIWEFTGASRISLRHISLMNLNTAWIRRVLCVCVCSVCVLLFFLHIQAAAVVDVVAGQLHGIATGITKSLCICVLLCGSSQRIAAAAVAGATAHFVCFKIRRISLEVLFYLSPPLLARNPVLHGKGDWRVFNISFSSRCRYK